MNADLERLIRLQQLHTATEEAKRRIDDLPVRAQALDARIETARAAVETARQRLAANQVARREIEKDLAAVQSRLSKFRDQLMEVKTNLEYSAMQKSIEAAQHEVSSFEDRVLERMLEADELGAAVKRAEAALGAEQAAVSTERAELERESTVLEAEVARYGRQRDELTASIAPAALADYELLARGRKGVAMAEARDGHCTICHVRLRPQVFNDVRRNETLIRCDSCQRILYFVPPAPANLASSAGAES